MKATELRIGNYIQDKKDREITIIQVAHISEGLINYWMESVYQPIKLTDQWLEKLGFYLNDGEDFNHNFYYIPIGGSKLHINPKEGVVWITRDKNIFNNPALIEHVHQIQNLYFALTGKELELQEQPQPRQ
jgi:hypothetical protein